jgi:hypothetical protein
MSNTMASRSPSAVVNRKRPATYAQSPVQAALAQPATPAAPAKPRVPYGMMGGMPAPTQPPAAMAAPSPAPAPSPVAAAVSGSAAPRVPFGLMGGAPAPTQPPSALAAPTPTPPAAAAGGSAMPRTPFGLMGGAPAVAQATPSKPSTQANPYEADLAALESLGPSDFAGKSGRDYGNPKHPFGRALQLMANGELDQAGQARLRKWQERMRGQSTDPDATFAAGVVGDALDLENSTGMFAPPDRFSPPPRGQFPQKPASPGDRPNTPLTNAFNGFGEPPANPLSRYPKLQAEAAAANFPADMAARSPTLSAAFLDAKTGQDPNYRFQPPEVSPTPAGKYANHLREGGGRMSDQQAYEFHQNNADPVLGTRYMPKVTGDSRIQQASAMGQRQQAGAAPGEFVTPNIGQADIMRGTDPVRDALIGQATTAKLMENPNGRWFGGAQINPRANSAPGVATFIDPSRPASPVRQAMGFDEAAKRAVARNPSLHISESGALVGSPNPDFAPPNAEQLAKNKAAYEARRGQEMDSRRAAVVANAGQRQEARRIRMGDLSAQERIAMADPRGAQIAQAAGANNELAREELNLRERLGMRNADVAESGNQARLRQQQMESAGMQIEAISAMEQAGQLTKPQADAARSNAFRQFQGNGGQQTSPVQEAVQGPIGPPRTNQREELEQYRNDPEAVTAELRRQGYEGDELNKELNKFYAEDNWSGQWTRSADDPGGWGNWFGGYSVNNKGKSGPGLIRWLINGAKPEESPFKR